MAVDSLLTIGRIASQTGVNVQTIRYYERCGLLPAPDRSAAGYRLYPSDHVRVIRFIKNTQNLGFSLAEIAGLLRLRGDNHTSCRHLRDIIQSKMSELSEQAARLRTMHANLKKLISSCRRQTPASACPIMDALDGAQISDGGKSRLSRQELMHRLVLRDFKQKKDPTSG